MIRIHFFSALLVGLAFSASVHAQLPGAPEATSLLCAASGEQVDGETSVLIVWPHPGGKIAAFNVYRRDRPSAPYVRINATAVAPLTDCREIREIIPEGKADWQLLDYLLGRQTSPCQVADIPVESKTFRKLMLAAQTNWRLALVMGLAYSDSRIDVGGVYWYQIRGVDQSGAEVAILDSTVTMAGEVTPLPAPTADTAYAGDAKVLITWQLVRCAADYEVQRWPEVGGDIGYWTKVSGPSTVAQCTTDLHDNRIPETNCFVDAMRWDDLGEPMTHLVDGSAIYGPYNGTTYRYRVAAVDILGRVGHYSEEVFATPEDSTPPGLPTEIDAVARGDSIVIRWSEVTHDEEGHRELGGIEEYRIYRFESLDLPEDWSVGDATPVCSVDSLSCTDADPMLLPDYGEQSHWYRVVCIDRNGNYGSLSGATEAHLEDTIPPLPPELQRADGFDDYIELEWAKPIDPESESPDFVPEDLAGYLIYRGICCSDSLCTLWVAGVCSAYVSSFDTCSLHLLEAIDDPDTLVYRDRSVPLGSPLCYRYAVKAYDRSQNSSDTLFTRCARLREKTPPPAPIISALNARNLAIEVEWVSPPVQDLKGFIVERSEDQENWEKVGLLPDPLDTHSLVECEEIEHVNIWAARQTFSFWNAGVKAKETYWYRVRGVDCGGNVGDPSAEIETYTFDFSGPATPRDVAVTESDDESALEIKWTPEYNDTLLGFVVFRSTNRGSGYRQISSFVRANTFRDDGVVRGVQYWYRVQYFAGNGNRSDLSLPEDGGLGLED